MTPALPSEPPLANALPAYARPGEARPTDPGSPEVGFDALESNRQLEALMLEHLNVAVPSAQRGVVERIPEARRLVEQQLVPLVRNDLDRSTIGLVALVVATYDTLAGVLDQGDARRLTDDAFNTPQRAWVLEGTQAMLDAAQDPFAAIVAASKEREESWFGPSFSFERPVDDPYTYILEVTRCLWHEALLRAGRTDLQPILCRADLNWVDAIDPARHGHVFVRPVTYASGDTCRMCFLRLEPGALADDRRDWADATTHR